MGGRHLGSEVVGPLSWILHRDVITAKEGPILLLDSSKYLLFRIFGFHLNSKLESWLY